MKVAHLNHAVLYVRDLGRSVEFYKSILGLEEVTCMGDKMAFLKASGSENHHDLGLFALGSQAMTPSSGTLGLYHLAWEVKRIEDLVTAIDLLKEYGCFAGASDHGASKSVYGYDPDGNEFEIMWLVPRDTWGEMEHQTMVAPLNLAWEVEKYSF
ncbi:glyoxalase [Nostocales cyanobacterium HT-58-2]|nr:glyoxalase [Nostocales cyanobacterium HT-58-2]